MSLRSLNHGNNTIWEGYISEELLAEVKSAMDEGFSKLVNESENKSTFNGKQIFFKYGHSEADRPHQFDENVSEENRKLEGWTKVNKKLVNVMKSKIDEALHGYHHDIIARYQPKLEGLWAVRCNNDGFHTCHDHYGAEMSVILYVDVPDTVHEDNHPFGVTYFVTNPNNHPGLVKKDRTSCCHVCPKPGKIVIFPSHIPHGTYPFFGSGLRTTINADFSLL